MKTLHLSSRAAVARPSPTLAITARAKALAAQGVPVISFGAGEPDFNTPQAVCDAAVRALAEGFTKYTASSGIPELRAAIADRLRRLNGIDVAPEQVVVSAGGKQAVYEALQVIVEPGDEAILFAPYWMTYKDQAMLAGANPVIVHCAPEDGYVPRLESLRAAITPRTRVVLLNSPNNPTGAVYPPEVVQGIVEVCIQEGLWLVCDEMYERLVYEGTHLSPASLGRDALAHTITIGGCSKTWAMTGWRIGWTAAPIQVARAMATLQDQITSNPTSFAQKGALAALQMDDDAVGAMICEFDARRRLILRELRTIPRLGVPDAHGAFYAFVNVGSFLGGPHKTDADLAEAALEQVHVAVVPGSVFEGEGCLRLSYTASQDQIVEGVSRLREFLAPLP